MSDNIFGERFRSRVEPAWHNLGIIFPADEEVLPSEAVARVAGDITIEARPMYYELADGTRHKSDHQAIVRLPTHDDKLPREFGVSSERWDCTPYVDLSRMLDRMPRASHKVETCGVLGGGELLFLALRGQDWAVLGVDEMRSYLTITLSMRVGTAHGAMDTEVRTVCRNTLQAAIAASKINLRIPHGADAAQQIGLCGDLIVRYKAAQIETKRIFDVFASTSAPDDSVEKIAQAAFPPPKLPAQLRLLQNVIGDEAAQSVFRRTLDVHALESLTNAQERHERALDRSARLQEAVTERFEAFEPHSLRGTVWAAYNAATEVSDWRGDGKTIGESVLIGSRAAEKARAFGAAYDLVK